MPNWNRYTVDPSGAYRFHDDATGEQQVGDPRVPYAQELAGRIDLQGGRPPPQAGLSGPVDPAAEQALAAAREEEQARQLALGGPGAEHAHEPEARNARVGGPTAPPRPVVDLGEIDVTGPDPAQKPAEPPKNLVGMAPPEPPPEPPMVTEVASQSTGSVSRGEKLPDKVMGRLYGALDQGAAAEQASLALQARQQRDADVYQQAEDGKAAMREGWARAAREGEHERASKDDEEARAVLRERETADFWTDKGTAAQVVGALAMALSGIGASMQGGGAQNLAVATIEKAMDRQLAVNRENQARAKDRLGANAARRGTADHRYAQDVAAINADKIAGYTEAQRKLREFALASGEQGRVVAAQIDAALELKKAQLAADNEARALATRQSGGGTTITRHAAKAGESAQELMFGGQRYQLGGYVKPEEGAQLRKKMVTIDQLAANVARLKELRNSLGEKAMASRQYQLLSNQIAAAGSTLQDMGVLQGNEREEYFDIFKNFRAGSEALEQMEYFAKRTGKAILDQSGAKPIGRR